MSLAGDKLTVLNKFDVLKRGLEDKQKFVLSDSLPRRLGVDPSEIAEFAVNGSWGNVDITPKNFNAFVVAATQALAGPPSMRAEARYK